MHANAPTYPVPDRFKTVQPVLKWSEHFKNGPSFKLVLNIYMYMYIHVKTLPSQNLVRKGLTRTHAAPTMPPIIWAMK